ncbi:MAG: apolipoprotein N-acyltransferase [Candidatus Omnitrophica bacterium]|jgi:apolipoprotein N-acyltransferase|nr:apolipoprotein N-acyltransferase [Candidatus Omnitrophota bacterium]
MLRTVISALLLALAFANLNLEFLAWFGFLPFFFAVNNSHNKKQSFILGFACGAIFWLGTIYWLAYVTAAGMLLLVLYLALYWGVFGLYVWWARSRSSIFKVFFIPALWVLLEYCRSYFMTGFPWALLGYSQHKALTLIQTADITGAWGVSFMVMMANAAIYEIIRGAVSREKNNSAISAIAVSCLFLCAAFYGASRMDFFTKAGSLDKKALKVSVVQGSIPQELKWDSNAVEYIMQRYISLSHQAAQEKPDLLIWPEASVPAILTEDSDFTAGLMQMAQDAGIHLLAGAVTSRAGDYYNSAVLFRPEGGRDIYDKLHLVPFGEYIPLPGIFGFLQTIVPIGEVKRGLDYKIFALPVGGSASGAKFSCLICFEDLFPELSRRFVSAGAGFLVTVTNDAWYQRTSAPFQHFQASVFRAIENRVPMVRSANTGVSGFIGPLGSVEGLVKDTAGNAIFVPGSLTRRISIPAQGLTVYTQSGDWFILLCSLIFLLGVLNICYNTFPKSGRRLCSSLQRSR